MKVNKVVVLMVLSISTLLVGCSHRNLTDSERTAILGASEKQAMENAQAQYPVQKAQSAKVKVKHFAEMEIKTTSTGLTVDGKPAAVIEKNQDATAYQQGVYNFIVYASGKIAVTKEGVFQGYAK